MSYLGQRIKRRVARAGMSGLSSRPYGADISRRALPFGATMPEWVALTQPTTTKRAMHGIAEYGTVTGIPTSAPHPKMHSYPMTVHGPALQGPPDWYRAMQGASLGDDQASGAPVITDGVAQWQQAMLSTTQQIADAQTAMAEKDKWIRYLQIAATLSIPLAAAVWKMIFRGGSGGTY
jgi:hypothetical protein